MDEKEIAVAANFYCNRRRRELGAKKTLPIMHSLLVRVGV